MNNKKIIIGSIIGIVITVSVILCVIIFGNSDKKTGLQEKIDNSEPIEIIVKDNGYESKGEKSELTWVPLAQLTTHSEFRKDFELLLGITNENGIKNGVLYTDLDGKQTNNSIMYYAFMNSQFLNMWNDETISAQVEDAVLSTYADLDDSDYKAAAINAYWNLLPDNQPNYFNGGESLTRAEAMTLLARATTPVEDLKANDKFAKAVGSSEYTDYASYVADDSYLTTEDKSLNNQTFNGTITRGEYIYMVLKNIYGSDVISNTDIKGVKLNDCKVTAEKYEYKETSYVKSYDLSYAIQSPDKGAPEDIYKAVAVAKKFNIISAESRWDEALTKSEAVEILIDTILSYNESKGYTTESESGAVSELEEQAKVAYGKVKDQLSCDEATYVSEYVKVSATGKTAEEVEQALVDMFKKENSIEVPEATVEVPTEPVTEAPTVEEPTTKPAYTVVTPPAEEETTEPIYKFGFTKSEWFALDSLIKELMLNGYSYEEAMQIYEEEQQQKGTSAGDASGAGDYDEELNTDDWYIK